VGKWDILGIIDEGVNNETRILLRYWNFHCKIIDEAWPLLEWIAWIRLSLKRLVIFRDVIFLFLVHFMLDHIMLLCGVTCVVLTIILHHALIMHVMLNLTLHHQGTVLMLS